jgi:uncharacterized protein
MLIVGGAVVLGYVAICLGLFLAQPKLIYFPAPNYAFMPDAVGLAYESVSLAAADGVPIAAVFVPHDEPRATVLFCHGNGENVGDLAQTLKTLHKLGFATLAFDYRGYGRSGGAPTEQGLYLDADAAWRWLTQTRGVPPEQVVIMGRSLGGAVAIELARRVGQSATTSAPSSSSARPGALVVECTFTSMVDLGRQEYPLLPINLLCTHRYESVKKVGQVTCPKLFLHGTDDTLIPLANARKLFDAAAAPKTFIETPGGHTSAGFEYNWETSERVRAWIEQAIGESEAPL